MTSGPPPVNDEAGVALADGVRIALLWDGDGEPDANPALVADGIGEPCVNETQPADVAITIRIAETAVRDLCIGGIVSAGPSPPALCRLDTMTASWRSKTTELAVRASELRCYESAG